MKILDVFSWLPAKEISIEELEQIFIEHCNGTYEGEYKVEGKMNVELYLKEMGQRIMERRKKLGLTQEALAELSELTTQFVSYAESGKRGMRPENLMKVAAALGVSTDYLLTGDIIDKDKLLLSDKLDKLTPQQVRIVENVVDECIALFSKDK